MPIVDERAGSGKEDLVGDEPDVGAGAPAGEDASVPSRPWAGVPELFILAAWIGFLVRVWQLHDRVPSWWQDSADYAEVGAHPLLSSGLWTGSRPPLVSYLIAGFGGEPGTQYVWFQVLLAAICWGALAAQVSAGMAGPRRWVGWGFVLAFSLTTPITMWDRSVLSESIGISLMGLFVAAGIWLLRRPTWWHLGALLAVALAWVMTRDTNIVVLGSVALVLAVAWLVVGRRHLADGTDPTGERPRRAWMLVGALGLCVVVVISMWSSSAGQRQLVPLRHVPLVSSLLWLPTIPTVAVAAAVAVWFRRRKVAVTPLVGVAGRCVVVSGLLAFIAWHADGMESARHLFFAAVLVRLGALFMVLSLLEVLPVGPGASASANDGSPPEGDGEETTARPPPLTPEPSDSGHSGPSAPGGAVAPVA